MRGRETLHSLAIHLHPALPRNIVFAHITFAFSRETFFSLLAKFLRFPQKLRKCLLAKVWHSFKKLVSECKVSRGMQNFCKQTKSFLEERKTFANVRKVS